MAKGFNYHIYVSLIYLNLFQSVRSFVRLLLRVIKNRHLIGWRNDVNANMRGSGSVYVLRSQPSLRHSMLLGLGLPGTTCAEVYCYCLV